MRRVIERLFFIGALILGIQGGAAHALLMRWEQSFELVVRDADCVVIGEIAREDIVASPAERFSSPVPWKRVVVNVEEVLLGKPMKQVIYFEPYNKYFPSGINRAPGTRAVFALVEGKRYSVPAKWRKGEPIYSDVAWTTPAKSSEADVMSEHESPAWLVTGEVGEIPSMRLQRFRSADEVVAAARMYSIRPAQSVDIEAVLTPFRLCEGNAGGWGPITCIPMDEAADKLAQLWSGWSEDTMAWNAVRLAKTKRTPTHVDILERIGSRPVTNEDEDATRAVALSKLQEWGEPADWVRYGYLQCDGVVYDVLRVISVLAFLVLPAWYLMRCRSGPLGWRFAVVFWLMILGGMGVTWARSFGPAVAMEAGQWDIGAVKGNVYAVFTRRWFDLKYRGGVQLLPAEALPNLVAAEGEYFSLDWGLGLIAARGNDSGQPVHEGWDHFLTFRLPFWLLLTVWLFPVAWVGAVRRIRQWRVRRRKGVEVVTAVRGRASD